MVALQNPTPIFVLTGFLGSGKTTLLNALLNTPEFSNTAVIVNEFGEVGLDHYLISRSQDNVVLLDSGCLCCTIADSLHETLADLNFRRQRQDIPSFTRVVVETTGLAAPGPILNTLIGHRLVTDHYCLNAVIVAVDAQHALRELAMHPEVGKQIAVGDRLVLTKTDVAPVSLELAARLHSLNPQAEMVQSVLGQSALEAFAPIDQLRVKAVGSAQRSHRHDHREPHGDIRHSQAIRAHCLVIPDPASWAGVAAWWRVVVDRYGDRILRCKGLVRIAEVDEIAFIQCVQRVFHRPVRLPDWPDADRRSRLVCITRDVDEAEIRSTLFALQLPPGSDASAFL